MGLKITALTVGVLMLAGCAAEMSDPIVDPGYAPPPPAPTVEPIQPSAPVAVTPLTEGGVDPALEMVEVDPYNEVREGAGGLTERLPDTCRLDQVQQYQGQSAAAVEGAGLGMPYRVIGPSDIVTQEYNPTRVNFFLNTGGTVDRISCG
ncbi:I78 family peptidase inhibitor [Tropicimonas isoalkanivorans]|uniref:Peptidase inhibitor I78 family protein n=1 Tax=Tropicimonas isoalkanivorans TaxID=441112 RepID=A0A1I1NW81_9RHOB|nr:I78 family peptidase inhibitor [Tropicimonas isoalkanivorans]SFD01715.1 Peptidase inhibitor I78 family protein [Tropicimonas isoalkanivorans]